LAWQQRVKKEDGNERRFAEKASYKPVETNMRSTNNFWVQTAPTDSLVKKS
jgi:hypothetical protein